MSVDVIFSHSNAAQRSSAHAMATTQLSGHAVKDRQDCLGETDAAKRLYDAYWTGAQPQAKPAPSASRKWMRVACGMGYT